MSTERGRRTPLMLELCSPPGNQRWDANDLRGALAQWTVDAAINPNPHARAEAVEVIAAIREMAEIVNAVDEAFTTDAYRDLGTSGTNEGGAS